MVKCNGCKRLTIPSMGEFTDGGLNARRCYAVVNPKTRLWVKGCGYRKGSDTDRFLADRLIGKRAVIIEEDRQSIRKLPKEDQDFNLL